MHPAPRRRSSPIVVIIAFAVGLIGTLLVVAAAARPDPTDVGRVVLHEKVDAYEALIADGHRFDIVFVGNSHVYRTVVPSVFDATMADLGCTVQSYNLGIPGLTIAEQRAVLDALEDTNADHGGPPTVVALGPVARLDVRFSDLGDLATFAFYDAGDLDDLVGPWKTSEYVQGRRLPEAVYVYAAAQVPYGSLHHQLYDHRIDLRDGDEYARFVAAIADDGYLSLEDEIADIPEVADRRRTIDAFVDDGRFAEAIDPNRSLRLDLPAELQRLEDRLSGVGSSTAILFLEPTVFHREAAVVVEEWQGTTPLLNLAVPEAIPELLTPEAWFDRTHVTAEVAQLASAELARQMCPALQARGLFDGSRGAS